jgi:HEAT repeat protein
MHMRWNSSSSIVDRRSSIVDRRSSIACVLVVLAVLFGPGGTVEAQKYTFEEVAAGLEHRDVATRLRAIEILKDADYAEAVAPIAATLGDADDRVQLAALDAIRSLFTTRPVSRRRKVGFVIEVRTVAGGDAAAEGQLALKPRIVPPQVLPGLVVALRDRNPRVRTEAVNLASLVAPQACVLQSFAGKREDCVNVGNALVDNINSREPELRRAAMRALGQLRYPQAMQALSDQLSYYQKGPDAHAALEGLAGIGHPWSASTFKHWLTSSNATMRRLAVEGFARAGDRDVLRDLQHMAQVEQSDAVLLSLHYAHLKLAAPGSDVKPLVDALREPARRPLALKYLLDLAPSVAPSLVESLGDQRPDIRRLIADVIGFSRNAAVIPALEAAAKDADADVAFAASQAIDRIKLSADPSLRAG